MSTQSLQPRSGRRWYAAAGEGAALAAAAGTYFLLLCGYYMPRSLREAMALEAGRERIAFLFTLTFVVMLVILTAYWWIVARVPRDRRNGRPCSHASISHPTCSRCSCRRSLWAG